MFFLEEAQQEVILKYRNFIDDFYNESLELDEKLNIKLNSFSWFQDIHFLRDTFKKDNFLTDSSVPEHTDCFELLQTCGNSHLNKLILVFASLTNEMNELAMIGRKFINPLLMVHEHFCLSSETVEDLECIPETPNQYNATAVYLSFLFDLICYLKRCYEVVTYALKQKNAMLKYASVKVERNSNLQATLRHILADLNPQLR